MQAIVIYNSDCSVEDLCCSGPGHVDSKRRCILRASCYPVWVHNVHRSSSHHSCIAIARQHSAHGMYINSMSMMQKGMEDLTQQCSDSFVSVKISSREISGRTKSGMHYTVSCMTLVSRWAIHLTQMDSIWTCAAGHTLSSLCRVC